MKDLIIVKVVMKPEEKANDLIDKFYGELYTQGVMRQRIAKQCALLCCDEAIAGLNKIPPYSHTKKHRDLLIEYYQQVKTVIKIA